MSAGSPAAMHALARRDGSWAHRGATESRSCRALHRTPPEAAARAQFSSASPPRTHCSVDYVTPRCQSRALSACGSPHPPLCTRRGPRGAASPHRIARPRRARRAATPPPPRSPQRALPGHCTSCSRLPQRPCGRSRSRPSAPGTIRPPPTARTARPRPRRAPRRCSAGASICPHRSAPRWHGAPRAALAGHHQQQGH